MRFVPAFLLAALFIQSPANSENKSDGVEIGRWFVSPTGKLPTCSAVQMVDDGQGFVVEYYAKTGSVWLGAENKDATSVADGTKVKLKIDFLRGKHLDDGWGEQEFTTIVGQSGARIFRSVPLTKEMLDDLSSQDFVAIMNGDKLVGGATLAGSAAMVAKLRECSNKAAGLNPKDPFVP